MDTLGGLLDAPRARGAFALRAVMNSPWSLRDFAGSPLTLIAGVAGKLWLVADDGDPVQIGPGDIAVIRAPMHYNLADSPAKPPQMIIHPGQRCCDLNGNSLHDRANAPKLKPTTTGLLDNRHPIRLLAICF
jgi:hypothetical protein